jgi:uncharacterized membrane protein YgcG
MNMSDQKTDKQLFSQFFQEESMEWLGLQKNLTPGNNLSEEQTKHYQPPFLPTVEKANEQDRSVFERQLRQFFRNADGSGTEQWQPALLAPYLQMEELQSDFPVWISVSDTPRSCLSIEELLQTTLSQSTSASGEAPVLRDNMARLERLIRKEVAFADIIYEAKAVFDAAMEKLEAELSIEGPEKTDFQKSIQAFLQALPGRGILIPFSPSTPFHLLSVFLENRKRPDQEQIQQEIDHATGRLKEMLTSERAKSKEAQSEEELHNTFEFADAFLKFDELSAVLPGGEADAMPEERLERIQKVLEILERERGAFFKHTAHIIADASFKDFLENPFTQTNWEWEKQGALCNKVSEVFDRQMQSATQLFGALRIARLEINNLFQPSLHADFFEHFNWRFFSEKELKACSPVFLLTSSEHLEQREEKALSDLLSSGRPVNILALRSSTAKPSSNDTPFELGALAIAHRNVYVLQSVGLQPGAILEGLQKGSRLAIPALFHLYTPSNPGKTLFFTTSAAAESRAFPSFEYHPGAGWQWGRRFSISDNPYPAKDWPLHQLTILSNDKQEESLEIAFTYADFAALLPEATSHFMAIPPDFWNDRMVSVPDFLHLDASDQMTHIPFIWMIDEKHQLQKAAVSWSLINHCLDRLDFWHFLQENAGVHNYHVEQATEQLKEELERVYEKRLEALRTDFQKQLEEVKERTGKETMERLAEELLGMRGREGRRGGRGGRGGKGGKGCRGGRSSRGDRGSRGSRGSRGEKYRFDGRA